MKFQQLTADVSQNLKGFAQDNTDVLRNFNALSRSAMQAGAIDEKTKEMIALAIGVSSRCDACIGFHVRTLVKMGTSLNELKEVLNVAVYMGGGPSLMYAANAIAAYQEFSPN